MSAETWQLTASVKWKMEVQVVCQRWHRLANAGQRCNTQKKKTQTSYWS